MVPFATGLRGSAAAAFAFARAILAPALATVVLSFTAVLLGNLRVLSFEFLVRASDFALAVFAREGARADGLPSAAGGTLV